MKLILLTLTLSLSFCAGCINEQQGTAENELVCDLYGKQVTPFTTKKLVFLGSESNFGPICVKSTDKKRFEEVWQMLKNAKLPGRHNACGYMSIGFYTSQDQNEPAAVLRVICGAGDDSGVFVEDVRAIYDKEEGWVGLYRCPGLESYIHAILEEEYKKNGYVECVHGNF